jgi:N-acyl-D-amino-acid deacylase
MKSGMFGYSSGLVYAPSVYSKTEELIALAKVVAEYHGIYASHIRGEGDHVMEAVDEAIRVGRESGADVMISHLKIMGEKNRGKAKEILEKLHRANEEGVRVSADQYPYDTGSAPLITQIPPKYLTKGIQEVLRIIANPDVRKQIEYSIFYEANEFESCLYFSGYEEAKIVIAPKTPQFVGYTLTQIAAKEHTTPIDAMMDILIANDGLVQGIYRCQDMKDVLTIMADKLVYAGCDWSAIRAHMDSEQVSGGHPRGNSTMIRRLELIRDGGLRTAENCIYSMTGGPARAVGLQGRGLIHVGYAADICVLDYPKVKAQSTFEHPFRKNLGLNYVFVNGEMAVQDGKCLGKLAGQTLLHK